MGCSTKKNSRAKIAERLGVKSECLPTLQFFPIFSCTFFCVVVHLTECQEEAPPSPIITIENVSFETNLWTILQWFCSFLFVCFWFSLVGREVEGLTKVNFTTAL